MLVIGGGNVAIDAARSAIRSGADRVRIICLEKLPEPVKKRFVYENNEWTGIRAEDTGQFMQAHRWEIEEALAEGVEIIDGGATLSFEIKNGRVSRASCLRVERIDKDSRGRLIPVLKDGTEFTVRADWVITSVGSTPDFKFLDGVPQTTPVVEKMPLVKLQDCGDVSIPVLAGGDIVTGPASIIEAIAAGRECALYFYKDLVGSPRVSLRYSQRRVLVPWANYADSLDHRARRKELEISMSERVSTHKEVCGSFAEKIGKEEADRCMRCDWPLMRESKVRKFFRSIKGKQAEDISSNV